MRPSVLVKLILPAGLGDSDEDRSGGGGGRRPHRGERACPPWRRSDHRVPLPQVRHLQTGGPREKNARRTTRGMGVAESATGPPPRYGRARTPGAQERETLK